MSATDFGESSYHKVGRRWTAAAPWAAAARLFERTPSPPHPLPEKQEGAP